MEIKNNYRSNNSAEYEVTLNKEDQVTIAEAYAWLITQSRAADINSSIEDRLSTDFAMLAISDLAEFSEDHKAYVNGTEIGEAQMILSSYQHFVRAQDRPVVSSTEHNYEWPRDRFGLLASDIANQLVQVQMNQKHRDVSTPHQQEAKVIELTTSR